MEKQKFDVMCKVQRSALKLASRTGFAYLLKRGFERPEWLYSASYEIPQYELTFAPALPPTSADIALCSRLLAAYQRAAPEPIGNTGIAPLWSEIIDEHYQPLLKTLEEGNAENLARFLSNVFQQGSSMGLTYGDDYKYTLLSRFWYLKILNDLVSLAEYLGVVRTENPEQGTIGHAFKDGPEALIKAIEMACGQELGFPAVGGPYGIQIGHSMITMETSEHTYAALRVNEAMDRNLPVETIDAPNIVEIGAGYGGTAYRLLKLRKERIGSYTIIDLPMMNVLQGYFLGSLFGPESISLYGEHHPGQETPLRIMPTVFINKMVERKVDLLLNENSMPEMPESTVEEYLRWAKRVVRGVFYSYNQETDRPAQGVPQVLVPAMVKRVGGFRRVSRDLSWIRRGYVEEVYLATSSLEERVP